MTADDRQRKANRRLGLILAAAALAVLFGYMARVFIVRG